MLLSSSSSEVSICFFVKQFKKKINRKKRKALNVKSFKSTVIDKEFFFFFSFGFVDVLFFLIDMWAER